MGEGGKGGGGSREIEHYYKNLPRCECACLRKTQQGNISVTPAAEEIKKNSKDNLNFELTGFVAKPFLMGTRLFNR